jgi:CHAT domain-containing protein
MQRVKIRRSILSLALLIISTVPQSISSAAPDPVSNVDRSLLTAARDLNQRGAEFLAAGKPDRALADWQQAQQLYTKINDVRGIIGTKINQAQALQSLGFYRQALLILQAVNTELQNQPDSELKLSGLLSLGNSLRALRILERKYSSSTQGTNLGAQETLNQALTIAKKLADSSAIDNVNLSLGNTLGLMGKERAADAIAAYRAIDTDAEPLVRVQAQLNLYRLEAQQFQKNNQLEFALEIRKILDAIAPSRSTIYAYINLAQTIETSAIAPQNKETIVQSAKLLATAIRQARTIRDRRGEAEAIGTLGNLYRSTGQLSEAKKLTQQAIVIAENLPAPDLAYKLAWQLGRIITTDRPTARDLKTAISLYSQAIEHLKSLRNDLSAIDADLQFSFRDRVEPVYREYVNLLLTDSREISQSYLAIARDAIEALQVAELENYLRQGCLDTYTVSLDKIDRSAAVIYPIILPDRVVTIASFPGQPLRYHSRKISNSVLEKTIGELRVNIQDPNFNTQLAAAIDRQSQQLYNLLIAPLSADLERAKIATLVFVLDGSFRNIPMSILSDGKQYLVEKYQLAITPGLQLVPPREVTTRSPDRALLGGISESRQGLAPLAGVKSELERIGRSVPNQTLLNEQFNDRLVADRLVASNAPIVHFATHGQFSSRAEDTFILTWDNRLNLDRLSSLLQNRSNRNDNSIDLLVLSACDTAIGDNHATLGLAGIAIRARAKSTIASLWSVSDDATQDLMISFYQNLVTKNQPKGVSLQLAQQALLRNPKYRAPYYWAPFVLVGNWQ